MARLFVGLALSDEFAQEIMNWEKDYQAWPVKWLAPANFHLTLVAPWEDKNREEAKAIFAAFSGMFKPVKANFSVVTFGPNPINPRLIWAKGEADVGVADIKAKTELALNLPDDPRPFFAHLTLARFRPEEFTKLPAQELNAPISWETVFDTLVLFESHLSPDGVDYERLAEIKLLA